MSKRRNATEANILAWLKRGDGQGEGKDYRPFFHVRDVPSKGRSTMVEGIKVPRTHHYLSDIEYGYHLLAEFAPDVTDIREQVALLPREETIEIARELGIRHPVYKETGASRVLTADIVLTLRAPMASQLLVVSGKHSSDLEPSHPGTHRTLEKLLIEKTYWSRRDARWFVGTEKLLPANKVANLDFFRQTMTSRELDHLNALLGRFATEFEAAWTEITPMNALLHEISARIHIPPEHSFTLLGRCLWMHILSFDLNITRFSHEEPMAFIRTPGVTGGYLNA